MKQYKNTPLYDEELKKWADNCKEYLNICPNDISAFKNKNLLFARKFNKASNIDKYIDELW